MIFSWNIKSKRTIFCISIVFLFVLAGFFQYIDTYLPPFWKSFCSFSSNLIFYYFIISWIISIKNRIIESKTRNILLCIGFLLLFYLLIRMVKYEFGFEESFFTRYLWYLYYLPQCLIPPLSFLSVIGLERKNKKPLSNLIYLILLPGITLIVLILTNDFHQKAFSFNSDFSFFYSQYKHQIVYYLAIAWIILITFVYLLTLFFKCSINAYKKKIWIPLLTFIFCVLVCVLCFVFNTSSYKMPELMSFSFILIFESCIRIGLISSNENYDYYFKKSYTSSLITDKNLNIIHSSASFSIEKDLLCKALKNKVFLNKNKILFSKPISGGFVFYVKDIKDINELKEKLLDIKKTLNDEKELLLYENEIKEKEADVKQKNHLYDSINEAIKNELFQAKKCINDIKENKLDYKKGLRLASIFYAI